jgi:hypothetical protein
MPMPLSRVGLGIFDIVATINDWPDRNGAFLGRTRA